MPANYMKRFICRHCKKDHWSKRYIKRCPHCKANHAMQIDKNTLLPPTSRVQDDSERIKAEIGAEDKCK